MKFLGNILTDGKFNETAIFNVVNDTSNVIESLPTLIIGWEKARSLYSNLSTLDWEISDNVYWTFGTREKRSKNESDIVKFTNMVLEDYIKSINYDFINIFSIERSEKIELVKNINDAESGCFYISDDILYVSLKPNYVFGISLCDIDYLGCDRKKMFSIVYRNKNLTKVTSDMISYDIRKFFKDNVYVVPTLFFSIK